MCNQIRGEYKMRKEVMVTAWTKTKGENKMDKMKKAYKLEFGLIDQIRLL